MRITSIPIDAAYGEAIAALLRLARDPDPTR